MGSKDLGPDPDNLYFEMHTNECTKKLSYDQLSHVNRLTEQGYGF